ncbi:MAG: hypothetical protein HY682_05330, partial [Chloroflexi bacterium]|nr:hypothetical protein [Chloroflexota bacterium]
AEGGIERNDNKSRVPVVVTGGAFSAEPQPLRALYLLRRSRDIERIVATRPPAGEAARRLLEHTTCLPFLPPDAVGRQFAFVADLAGRVPVWELRYPSGFQYIDPVVERVLECSR